MPQMVFFSDLLKIIGSPPKTEELDFKYFVLIIGYILSNPEYAKLYAYSGVIIFIRFFKFSFQGLVIGYKVWQLYEVAKFGID
ncbi:MULTISPECIES: hypothetical protein [Chryseobacterium]|uniref:Uncharacterized protein n=1 Tax=Chryseobacterium taihuense TaxID=1141221 RepID=A0A4U8WAB0_9FLAO|nr:MULTISPECIES: hypothetical protein [Chryseobacterium]QQV04266.1 hypothetical protein I6I61_07990 [Chryseobacterium sp. FDAARGOS 1104]VFB02366.1 Uncharacterised protein [Chryseobacterium taihuense]